MSQEFKPTHTPPGVKPKDQVRFMMELNGAASSISSTYQRRNDLIHALSLSGTLSRRDMARATGLNKSRIDQIIRSEFEAKREVEIEEAKSRVARHVAF